MTPHHWVISSKYFKETGCLHFDGPGGLPLVWHHTPKNRALTPPRKI